MKVSVFGLGYVGTVSAACLSAEGHEVIGVDPNETKVGLINDGKSPIIEPELEGILAESVANGRLSATTDAKRAVLESSISLVCVGTPSQPNGSLELKYIRQVCQDMGAAMKGKTGAHYVVARSTMLPGTVRDTIIPELEAASGRTLGKGLGVALNPEFLREGTAVADYRDPPLTVIGATDKACGEAVAALYEGLDAPLLQTAVETAELVKYTANVWHAVKVGFANEIGNIAKAVGVDGHDVMDIFMRDTKLNISPKYLKPGFAFGGSCLPKDVRALTYKARSLDVTVPILESVLPSNQNQIDRAVDMILDAGNRRVGLLGLSFKEKTDDLRESPLVELVERLIGKGYDIKIFDRNVHLASLMGANKDYILNHIPHISRLLVETPEEVLEHAETLVIGNRGDEFRGALEAGVDAAVVIDLVRMIEGEDVNGRYEGICW